MLHYHPTHYPRLQNANLRKVHNNTMPKCKEIRPQYGWKPPDARAVLIEVSRVEIQAKSVHGRSGSVLANGSTAGAPPHIAAPSHQALHGGSRRVQRGPDIKVKDRLAGGLRGPGVVIDNVADFLRAGRRLSQHVPVMAVERRVRPEHINTTSPHRKRKGKELTRISPDTHTRAPEESAPWASTPSAVPGTAAAAAGAQHPPRRSSRPASRP